MVEDTSYTIKQAAEFMDETIQRIGYWVVSGVFNPADPSSGTGSSRRLSFQNLLEIKIASQLSKSGFHVHVIASVLEAVREEANRSSLCLKQPRTLGNNWFCVSVLSHVGRRLQTS